MAHLLGDGPQSPRSLDPSVTPASPQSPLATMIDRTRRATEDARQMLATYTSQDPVSKAAQKVSEIDGVDLDPSVRTAAGLVEAARQDADRAAAALRTAIADVETVETYLGRLRGKTDSLAASDRMLAVISSRLDDAKVRRETCEARAAATADALAKSQAGLATARRVVLERACDVEVPTPSVSEVQDDHFSNHLPLSRLDDVAVASATPSSRGGGDEVEEETSSSSAAEENQTREDVVSPKSSGHHVVVAEGDHARHVVVVGADVEDVEDVEDDAREVGRELYEMVASQWKHQQEEVRAREREVARAEMQAEMDELRRRHALAMADASAKHEERVKVLRDAHETELERAHHRNSLSETNALGAKLATTEAKLQALELAHAHHGALRAERKRADAALDGALRVDQTSSPGTRMDDDDDAILSSSTAPNASEGLEAELAALQASLAAVETLKDEHRTALARITTTGADDDEEAVPPPELFRNSDTKEALARTNAAYESKIQEELHRAEASKVRLDLLHRRDLEEERRLAERRAAAATSLLEKRDAATHEDRKDALAAKDALATSRAAVLRLEAELAAERSRGSEDLRRMLKEQAERHLNTTASLSGENARLKAQIEELEATIRVLKAKHKARLRNHALAACQVVVTEVQDLVRERSKTLGIENGGTPKMIAGYEGPALADELDTLVSAPTIHHEPPPI
ncbi:hypothetical protein CTAYLR_001258 [Chrysophaeum taylorii]|uniref:Uncharacterized protein n=1 Tax=Chrysophaeum taylorii TaxID=2483200 RepID=A0AAD7UE30_9STRA|nr:hypothetical protein CTAYLR_001258 [Chrysophaeum taylorii]